MVLDVEMLLQNKAIVLQSQKKIYMQIGYYQHTKETNSGESNSFGFVGQIKV